MKEVSVDHAEPKRHKPNGRWWLVTVALALGNTLSAAAQEAPSEPSALTPPRLLDANAPLVPEGAADVEPVVLVHLVVEADGHVGEAHVEVPHDAVLDAAAIEAVRTWLFEART